MFAASKTKGVSAVAANYIEDVFSTYLYTGNGSTQTITNGIDLAGKGGLVWIKDRIYNSNHFLFDTVQGATKYLSSNATNASTTDATSLTAFNANGFAIGSNADINFNASKLASWTFRKQPKFFDVVTYTGTGAARTIAHNLGSAPRFMLVKRTDTTGNWCAYHSDLGATQIMFLNTTAAAATNTTYWNSTNPNTTVFSVGTNAAVNASGGSYVAYLFASDAGGFGLTGTDNVISCGSFTSNASDIATVDLGFEPQLVIMKAASTTGQWWMADNMRGFTTSGEQYLLANSSGAEAAGTNIRITNTGFIENSTTGSATTYIYIAIRRGPMKVPTDATKVFTPQIYTGNGTSNRALTGFGFSPDLVIQQVRSNLVYNSAVADRLRGVNNTGSTIATPMLRTNTTEAEGYSGATQSDIQLLNMDGITVGPNSFSWSNGSGYNNALWNFRRAPSFFDEVCYTGTGSATTVTHNLGVAPEMMIVKSRSSGLYNWLVYHVAMGNDKYAILNTTAAQATSTGTWNNTTPTASVFSLGNSAANASGATYVWYGFATCPGVSKVGSYTGNGSTQTINCGFTGGARFVLIKRTDSTGDWYVYDTARGMTTLTDPYLLLNSTAAESATLGSVTTVTTGFAVNAAVLAAINTNGASYIFLAIA